MQSLDPQEMVRYFSDFLTEINSIIRNIKHHTYEMVDISIPNPSVLQVYQSMASIISSTHKTYDDLKRIESVMTGVVKARRIVKTVPPSLFSNANLYSQSQNSKCIKLNQQQDKINSVFGQFQEQETGNDARTIKRKNIKKTQPKLQLLNLNNQAAKIVEPQIKVFVKEEEDQKTVKYMTDRDSQSMSQRGKNLNHWKKILQERIEGIIKRNRLSLNKILQKNQECLRLVKSLRKDYKSKG